jgi:phospholipase/lecithinase/hemolysin
MGDIMKIKNTFVAFSALLLMSGNVWAAPSFSTLYTFGDSLSDAGSSDSAIMSLYKSLGNICDPGHPCPPYFDGRFSNGPVASEQLAAQLFPGGVTPLNFRSYAVAGANTGDSNSGSDLGGLLKLPGMKQEVDNYLSDSNGKADPNALYFLWGGANDYLSGDSPTGAAQNIGGYVSELAGAGAKHILVPNLPDLSLTPFGQDHAMDAHAYTTAFNSALAAQLGIADSQFPGTDIFRFDSFSFVNGVVQNGAKYGFTDVQDPCLTLLIPCGNQDQQLFWDTFHPTTRADGIIASAFAMAVPEPEMISMFIAGLVVLGFAARASRRPGNPGYAWIDTSLRHRTSRVMTSS